SDPDESWTFDLPSDLILLGESFAIGWAVNCANDVIYEKMPVPESATVLLLGAGLIFVAGFSRRRLLKRQ
ncbi:MAG: PEP-CTERM sorting domain-containing protein, partial [Deltaproteobacteria bacterium]|nr:PEP-CTERM sorting domain-containing protein [Deltaproteobacteria bacterium]